jgi:hypothetical protein
MRAMVFLVAVWLCATGAECYLPTGPRGGEASLCAEADTVAWVTFVDTVWVETTANGRRVKVAHLPGDSVPLTRQRCGEAWGMGE